MSLLKTIAQPFFNAYKPALIVAVNSVIIKVAVKYPEIQPFVSEIQAELTNVINGAKL